MYLKNKFAIGSNLISKHHIFYDFSNSPLFASEIFSIKIYSNPLKIIFLNYLLSRINLNFNRPVLFDNSLIIDFNPLKNKHNFETVRLILHKESLSYINLNKGSAIKVWLIRAVWRKKQ